MRPPFEDTTEAPLRPSLKPVEWQSLTLAYCSSNGCLVQLSIHIGHITLMHRAIHVQVLVLLIEVAPLQWLFLALHRGLQGCLKGACLKGASKGFKEGPRGASVVSSKGGP